METAFLHPGAMGASLASVCRGTRLWVGTGRSVATRQRALAGGMQELSSLDDLVGRADIVFSVCPPAAAVEVAREVQRAGFDGIYVDANAVAPATARAIGELFPRFVDGAVIGPPVRAPGTTRLYLSGVDAPTVAELWRDTDLETRVLDGDAGAASALKVCYAAWTKGTDALLLAIRALARVEGVEGALLDQWSTSIPELVGRSDASASKHAPKAWRYAGEMEESAAAFAAQDLPGGFVAAAAEVYRRLESFKDDRTVTLSDVVEELSPSARAGSPPDAD